MQDIAVCDARNTQLACVPGIDTDFPSGFGDSLEFDHVVPAVNVPMMCASIVGGGI